MKIIYISGIDGCGKTTQAKKLLNEVLGTGINANYLWLRWEPSFKNIINKLKSVKIKSSVSKRGGGVENENAGESDWLKLKRNMLGHPLIRNIWLMYACYDYYLAYRKQFKKIQCDVVIIDRYVDDFIIDQAVNLNIPPERMHLIQNKFFLNKFHFPDYRIIIDLPAREGYKRKLDGTPLSYLETREKYYMAMQGDNTLHLNGLESIDEVASQIKNWAISRLSGDRS